MQDLPDEEEVLECAQRAVVVVVRADTVPGLMSGLINTVPVSPPPGVKSVGSKSGSLVTQPAVVAASFPLGQVVLPTVDVAPSALSVTLPLYPFGRVTG